MTVAQVTKHSNRRPCGDRRVRAAFAAGRNVGPGSLLGPEPGLPTSGRGGTEAGTPWL
jgi:hypothetical protein